MIKRPRQPRWKMLEVSGYFGIVAKAGDNYSTVL